MRGRPVTIVVIFLALVLLSCVALAAVLGDRGGAASSGGDAAEVLATLTVAEAGTLETYERDEFGSAWPDVDDNGCDTRDDILRRDLADPTVDDDGCTVRAGTLEDPYSGETLTSTTLGRDVQIDHVVALADAWTTGADAWDRDTRLAFANDPLNLIATVASENTSKGARDAAEWLPTDTDFWCPYVARQVAVKAKYGLAVTRDEHDRIADVLTSCPAQDVPVAADASLPAVEVTGDGGGAAAVVPTTVATVTSTATGGAGAGTATDPSFAACSSAAAQGYGPYTEGTDPEYSWYRDPDGDGVACE